ncbi:MAG: exo-rhamnogalacturonan lyase family protein [Planctomycetota bacterium]
MGGTRKRLAVMLVMVIFVLAYEAVANVVPIVVKGNAATRFYPAPVKCGVPFPKGVLQSAEGVTLVDGDGKAVTFQTLVTATWSKDEKDGIRWLLIDFLAEKGKEYKLLYGDDSKSAAVKDKDVGEIKDGKILINTGVLKTTCSENSLDLFTKIFTNSYRRGSIDPATTDKDSRWGGIYLEHAERGIFRSDLDKDVKIELEENGPVRAVIKAEGDYTNEAGEKFSKFIARIHFFKGRRNIKLEHTFIFTGNSVKDKLRDIAVKIPMAGKVSDKWSSTFTTMVTDDSIKAFPVDGKGSHFYQVMDSPDHRNFEWLMYDGSTGEISPRYTRGQKIGGAFHGKTQQNTLISVVKDAWQQYPIELEWNKGDATIHFWPKHGRLWDTSWDGMFYYLTEEQKKNNVRRKPKVSDKNFNKVFTKLRNKSNACASAKTHEAWFFFNNYGTWNYGINQAWNYVHKPVYAHADLKWQTSTKALDYVMHQPLDMKNFGDEENFMSSMLTLMQAHVDYVHYYGWWEWGGYHEHLNVSDGGYARDLKKFGDTFKWHRARPKAHYYWASFPWMQYFRTGKAEWLDYGNRFTRYSSDTAFRHADAPEIGRMKGEEYHYDNSELHWIGGWYGSGGGGAVAIVPTCDRDDYLFRYWLTGERRSYDVLVNWAEQYKKDVEKNGENTHQKRVQKWMPYGNAIRNIGGALDRLCLAYMATHDEKLLEFAGELAAIHYDFDFLKALRKSHLNAEPVEQRTVLGNSWYANWLFQGLFRYAAITGKPEAKKAAIYIFNLFKEINAGMPAGRAQTLNWASYGYELTKDKELLRMGKGAVAKVLDFGVRKESFQAGGIKFRIVSMPRMLGAIGSGPEEWKKDNLPMDKRNVISLYYYDPIGKHMKYWQNGSQGIYLLDESDEEFKVKFSAYRGGLFTVFDPDGKQAVKPVEIRLENGMNHTFTIPEDGKKGTYTLLCIKHISDKDFGTNRYYGHTGDLRLISCSLPKQVYRVASEGNSNYDRKTFTARGWYFGVPAGIKAEVHWRPNQFEAGGQRHFQVEEVSDSEKRWKKTTKELVPLDNEGKDSYGDYNRYTFDLPKSDKTKIYHCKILTENHSIMKEAVLGIGCPAFVIKGAPAFISETPESWYAPKLPEKYDISEEGK